MCASVPSVILNNGYSMPILGLGTWKTVGDEALEVFKKSIDLGYRMMDTSPSYDNEDIIGRAIKEKIEEGVIERKDLFISTKLVCTENSPERIIASCRNSLKSLGLDYLDLYIIHWPTGIKEGFIKTSDTAVYDESVSLEEKWETMEELVTLGLVRSIGLSNYNSKQVSRILKIAKIKPVVNQVECHPLLNQKKLIKFCKERDVVVIGYSPFTSPFRPRLRAYFPDINVSVLDNPKIKRISEKVNKSTAQVILRYLLSLDVVQIPHATDPKFLEENINVFDFDLSSEDKSIMDSINNNTRVTTFEIVKDHSEYPFNIEF